MEAIVDLRDQDGLLVPKANELSPTYQTQIFDFEECGDEDAIDAILYENIDPSLSDFADSPLLIEAEE